MRTAHTPVPTPVPVPGHGAEDVVVDSEGWVLTGTEDGSVFRVRPDGGRIDRVGSTGGRPLGLELLPDGRVLVCDSVRGLLALDVSTGRTQVLADLVHGQRILVCNNAAVHTDGSIFFSDSSRVHPLERYEADLAEDTASGRLLRRDPDGTVEVLVDGLRFANGVALSADESFVVVAQSGGRSVVRRWLSGPRAGQDESWVSDLPGYPDNVSRGTDGLIWVAVASPTLPSLERVMKAPHLVRRASWRLPHRLRPTPPRSARVMAFDDDGALVHDLDLDPSAFHFVTGVREHEGRVWLGSLHESAVAYVDLPSGADRS